MFQKLKKKLVLSEFAGSAAILFVSNITVAVFNYSIVILAGRILGNNYSLWTALNSIITILMTINIGLYSNIMRTVARLYKQKDYEGIIKYYAWYRKVLGQLVFVGLMLSPFLAYLINFGVSGASLIVSELIVVFVFLNILLGVQQNFLIGTLQNKTFAISMVIANFMRLLATGIILTTRHDLGALPLGLIASTIMVELISNYFWQKRKIELTAQITNLDTSTFVINSTIEVRGSIITIISMVLLSSLLNINPILIQNSNFSNTDKDLMAVLFNFGQIIHFASIAGLTGLIAYCANSTNKRIYLLAIGLATSVTAGVCVAFFVLGKYIFEVFGRAQYASQINWIFLYAIFIAAYNIIYVSIQYLIAQRQFIQIWIALFGLTLIVLLNYLFGRDINSNFNISIGVGLVTALLMMISVWRLKLKNS